MRRPVIALCLAGGGLLASAGVVIWLAMSQASGLLAAAGGIGLLLAVAWTLRRAPNRSEMLWTAVLDAVLLVGIGLALLPIVAIVRGFVDLFTQTHVHSTREAIAYALAFAG